MQLCLKNLLNVQKDLNILLRIFCFLIKKLKLYIYYLYNLTFCFLNHYFLSLSLEKKI